MTWAWGGARQQTWERASPHLASGLVADHLAKLEGKGGSWVPTVRRPRSLIRRGGVMG